MKIDLKSGAITGKNSTNEYPSSGCVFKNLPELCWIADRTEWM